MLTDAEKIDIVTRGLDFQSLRDNKALQVLLDMMQSRAEEAREKLCDVSPGDAAEISRLQTEVFKFKEILRTINGFINEGEMMEAQLAEESQLTE